MSGGEGGCEGAAKVEIRFYSVQGGEGVLKVGVNLLGVGEDGSKGWCCKWC